jgi:hypothetical protein
MNQAAVRHFVNLPLYQLATLSTYTILFLLKGLVGGMSYVMTF